MGLFDKIRRKKEEAQNFAALDAAIGRSLREKEYVDSCEDMTPGEVDGQKLAYRYKDVRLRPVWQYCGRYGKDLHDLGVEHGDELSLRPTYREEDPNNVSAFFGNIEIAYMRENRLRDMVRQWREANKPVRCVVILVGQEIKLSVELAFYGYVRKKAD